MFFGIFVRLNCVLFMCLRIALIWSHRSSVSIFTNWGSGGLMLIKLSTFKFLRCNSHIKIYEKCYGKTSLGSKYLNQVYPADFPTVTVGHSQSSCWGGFWTMEIEDVNNTPLNSYFAVRSISRLKVPPFCIFRVWLAKLKWKKRGRQFCS